MASFSENLELQLLLENLPADTRSLLSDRISLHDRALKIRCRSVEDATADIEQTFGVLLREIDARDYAIDSVRYEWLADRSRSFTFPLRRASVLQKT